ncbi:threonine synthase [Pectinatus cerevisiiphilus]|uniref:Threonine synthase n=1 Tax=Pectinatus cerevisiiphilus TaxID=86956 RepID=A0A4R3KAR5_9FIRM|nr:threonine synthase [Pectinatus cerevisiiphilus]TCS79741.1 threonine synthase [Pectinatus cerevisiiphilus]
MKYTSTRSKNDHIDAAQAIIKGIAADGGLFVPDEIPQIDNAFLMELLSSSYQERASKILSLYLPDYTDAEISHCVQAAYTNKKFDTPAIAPLTKLADGKYILELWHGPTSAFKDMALQLLPQLMSTALQKTKQKNDVVILVATSGDTGKAALEGFCDVPKIKIIVFYPQHGVSHMQRRQMITQKGNNVAVIAIEGNFDDAQTGVKNIFNNKPLNKELHDEGYELSSANSINWGRLLPQIVYYFSAYCELVKDGSIKLAEKVNYSVPTGNFGDILAGYYAKRMGLPINKLVCASNSNNVLTDFFTTGKYDRNREFFKTISPSMDILISSNLERLLYHITGDAAKIKTWMDELNEKGSYTADKQCIAQLQEIFAAGWVDEKQTLTAIKDVYDAYDGYTIDPHTAVAWQAAQNYQQRTGDMTPMVVLSTASPYKFNDSVLTALHADTGNADDFALLDMLQTYNKSSVPAGLASLKIAAILHKKTCTKENMAAEIKDYLKHC